MSRNLKRAQFDRVVRREEKCRLVQPYCTVR
jgi:hypothetical protein